jgi:molecular chaperone DnaJ
VVLNVLPSDTFERHGRHLVTEVKIDYVQAALGCEIEIPTVRGSITQTLKPGTQPGTQIVVANEGVPHRGYGRGDLIVQVTVEIPTKLDGVERDLLLRLAEHRDLQVDAGATKPSLLDRIRGKA